MMREEPQKQRFAGKVLLVTGGTSGIGLATAKRIAQEGGTVIITGRDKTKLELASKEIGPKVTAIQSDVSRLEEIDLLMGQIKSLHGRLDGVFANAGIVVANLVEAVTEEEFDRLFSVNVKGVFFTLQRSIPLLNDNAAIVLNASVVSTTGSRHHSIYSASKAAVRSMARTFSASLIDRGIRVNAVSPGPIATPMWDAFQKETIDAYATMNPTKRFGTMDEVASAVTFLLSSESSYIVGTELFVDGGFTQL